MAPSTDARNVRLFKEWARERRPLWWLAKREGVGSGTMARWVREGQKLVAARASRRRYNLDRPREE